MAGDIKWIKVITDIFEDEKVKLIKSMPEGRTLVLIWFQLLVQAGKTNAAGWIYLSEGCAYTPAMLATLFNETQQMVELALKLFSTKPFDMIEINEDGLIYIPNWEKHQNVESMDKIRENNRLRKAKQREKQKLLVSRDSPVTSHQNHATDIDIDIDTEKEISSSENPYRLFQNEIGVVSGTMSQMLQELVAEYGEQHVCDSIREAVRQGKRKLSYIEGILKRWKTDGKDLPRITIVPDKHIPTAAEIKAEDERKKKERQAALRREMFGDDADVS